MEHLLRVIRGVALGESWLPPRETADVIQLLIWGQDRHRENELLLSKLTARERAVLACLTEGAAHRDVVAKQLHLSVNTVRTHMRNLMAKLGVHSMLEAVALTRDNASWLDEDGGTSPDTRRLTDAPGSDPRVRATMPLASERSTSGQ